LLIRRLLGNARRQIVEKLFVGKLAVVISVCGAGEAFDQQLGEDPKPSPSLSFA